MTQYVINIGAIPNDGTGDPLRTAFNETNLNFDQVFAAGPVLSNIQIANNKILTTNTNGNLVLAPNGTGVIQANVSIVPNLANLRNLGSATNRWSTVYTQYLNATQINLTGDLTVAGNLTVQGNIIQLGNIITDSLTIQLANTASTANAANGAGITVGANDDIATLLFNSSANTWATNIGLQITGNITSNYYFGNVAEISGQNGRGEHAANLGAPGFTELNSNVIVQVTGNADSYTQINFQNINSGNRATTDFIATSAFGTDSTFFVDMGIASNSYDQNSPDNSLGTALYPQDSYLYSQGGNSYGGSGGNLVVGSNEPGGVVRIIADGSDISNIVATFSNVGISTAGNIFATGNITSNGNVSVNRLRVNQTANAWNIAGNTITAPSGATWNSNAISKDEYITSALDGYINLTSLYANGNTASQVHLEHGLAQIVVDNGTENIWAFDATGNLTLPGNASSINYANGTNIFSTIAVYGNANVAQYLPVYSGNILANYYVGNVAVLAGQNIRGEHAANLGASGFTELNSNVILQITGNANSYAQINFQNIGNGTAATTDYIATAQFGTDSTYFVDMGIASGTYDSSNPDNSLGNSLFAQDSYLYAMGGNNAGGSGGNLVVGSNEPGGVVRIIADGSDISNIVATFSNAGVDVKGNVVPVTSNVYSLGNSTNQWSDLYVSNATIYMNNVPIGLTAGNVLTVNGEAVLTNDSDTTISTTGNVTADYFFGNIEGSTGNITNLDSLNFSVENINALVGNNGVNIGAGGYNNLVVLPTDVLIQNVPLTVAGNILSTVAGGLNITANTVANGVAQVWNFGTDGNLTVPGNIQSISTGIPFSSNISGINTGSPTVIVTLTDAVFGAAEIGQVTISGVVGTTQANNTWYYASIDPSNFVLYNDAAVTIPVNGNTWTAYISGGLAVSQGYSNISITGGNVSVTTGTGNTWLFGTDGILTFPGTPRIATDSDNFEVQAAESINFEANAVVNIYTDTSGTAYQWQFGDDGNFTLPGNLVIAGNTSIFGTNRALIQPADDLPLLALSSGANGAVSSIWVEDIGNIGTSNIAAVYANPTVGSKIVRIVVGQNGVGSGPNLWDFDTTGNLTVPGNIIMTTGIVGSGASPAPYLSGFSSVSAVTVSASGNVTGNTAGFAIGYRDIPQVAFTSNATIATADAGKHFYSTESSNYILTIANNASQGFQVGAAITVVNQGTGNITVAQGSGVTLYLAGNATSGNRTVATFGMATIMKVATDTWFINGTGVS